MLTVFLTLTLLALSSVQTARAEESNEELMQFEGEEEIQGIEERQFIENFPCPEGKAGKACRRYQRQQGVELEERQFACPEGKQEEPVEGSNAEKESSSRNDNSSVPAGNV